VTNELLAVALIVLTGPGGQVIDVNPAEIVSIREPREESHFGKDVHCLINTVDGKFITVVETCDIVRNKINNEEGY
jgi:hypothetical protein